MQLITSNLNYEFFPLRIANWTIRFIILYLMKQTMVILARALAFGCLSFAIYYCVVCMLMIIKHPRLTPLSKMCCQPYPCVCQFVTLTLQLIFKTLKDLFCCTVNILLLESEDFVNHSLYFHSSELNHLSTTVTCLTKLIVKHHFHQ